MKLDLHQEEKNYLLKRKPLRKKSLALLKKMFNQSGMEEGNSSGVLKSSKKISKKENRKDEIADLKSMRRSLWQFLGLKKKSKSGMENSLQ